jgi:hypothetical protein
MRPSRHAGQRGLALVASALGLTLLAGGCLPASVRPTPTPAPTFEAYAVRSGDSLVAIARRFGTDGRSIAYWNRQQYPSLDPESAGYRPDNLQIGWVLQILRGGAWVPPEDDGESGEQYTPPPEEEEEFEEEETVAPEADASPAP